MYRTSGGARSKQVVAAGLLLRVLSTATRPSGFAIWIITFFSSPFKFPFSVLFFTYCVDVEEVYRKKNICSRVANPCLSQFLESDSLPDDNFPYFQVRK
jgi:hypothetical protein